MDNSENNKLRMYKTSHLNFMNSQTKWEGIQAIVKGVTTLGGNIKTITDYDAQLQDDGSGKTEVKVLDRAGLEKKVLHVSGGGWSALLHRRGSSTCVSQ